MATTKDKPSGPFYHGTKADLAPGDLITPGFRSNYGHSRRKTRWVYITETLSPLAAQLARGDGPGRIYIVEPTGPLEDDPDLTDKKFAGNPTRSYRSRAPVRVVGEVTDWQPHSPEQITAILEGQQRLYAQQAARIACIPDEAEMERIHVRAEAQAREWASDAEFLGATLLMHMRGTETAVFAGVTYRSSARGGTHTLAIPPLPKSAAGWSSDDIPRSGRVTGVTAWRDGWAAAVESCITEIGLSREARMWVAADAVNDSLRIRLEADGPERSWQRNFTLARGVLTDAEQGELWNWETDRADG